MSVITVDVALKTSYLLFYVWIVLLCFLLLLLCLAPMYVSEITDVSVVAYQPFSAPCD